MEFSQDSQSSGSQCKYIGNEINATVLSMSSWLTGIYDNIFEMEFDLYLYLQYMLPWLSE